jgi:hypothetical protein
MTREATRVAFVRSGVRVTCSLIASGRGPGGQRSGRLGSEAGDCMLGYIVDVVCTRYRVACMIVGILLYVGIGGMK